MCVPVCVVFLYASFRESAVLFLCLALAALQLNMDGAGTDPDLELRQRQLRLLASMSPEEALRYKAFTTSKYSSTVVEEVSAIGWVALTV